jgi:hypothetical protein
VDTLRGVTRAAGSLLLAVLLGLAGGGCRRTAPRRLDAVRALKASVQLQFHPPADGLLTDAMLDSYLKVRRQARSQTEGEALRATGTDAAAYAWTRARVQEAMLALESGRVAAAAGESFARAEAVAREARRSARDPKVVARLDSEIAALERERAGLRKGDAFAPVVLRNASRVGARRAEIEEAGP